MPFRIALSGLEAASQDLAVTGNNIANASTTGFKESRAEFADVYASSFLGVSSSAAGSGVRVSDVAQQFTQGNVEFTDNNLDLAINGDGFFILDDAGAVSYTRAGSFQVDRDGYVVDNQGARLQIFPPSSPGSTVFNTGVLSDLQLQTGEGAPQATSSVIATLNLDASETTPVIAFDPALATSFNHSTSLTIFDSLGSAHTATMYYVKTATPNEWDAYLYVDGSNVPVGGSASQTLTFDSGGALTSPTGGIVAYDAFTPAAGAASMSLTYDYSAMTQYGTNFGVNSLNQDGFTSGRLAGIDIDSSGVVFARFTNGQSLALGQVAMARVPNTQGLQQLGNTAWSESFESGDVLLGTAGTASFGNLQAGALEASNVDIAEQLVNLITAQRNFQANAQVITTADAVTQTIINIR